MLFTNLRSFTWILNIAECHIFPPVENLSLLTGRRSLVGISFHLQMLLSFHWDKWQFPSHFYHLICSPTLSIFAVFFAIAIEICRLTFLQLSLFTRDSSYHMSSIKLFQSFPPFFGFLKILFQEFLKLSFRVLFPLQALSNLKVWWDTSWWRSH